MTELAKDAAIDTLDLLTRYSFDLAGYPIDYLIDAWLRRYPIDWLRLAVIEALYQGRYKAVSVEQILNLWTRRGKPLPHFNREFERIICSRVSKTRASVPYAAELSSQEAIEENGNLPAAAQLSSGLESAPAAEVHAVSGYELAADLSPVLIPRRQPLAVGPLPLSAVGDLPVRALKPPLASTLDSGNLARAAVGKYPIDQFIPAPEPSEFYMRLKAVAQAGGTVAEPVSPAVVGFYGKLKTAAQNHLAPGRSTSMLKAPPEQSAPVPPAPPDQSSN